jgi:hypothetical protein
MFVVSQQSVAIWHFSPTLAQLEVGRVLVQTSPASPGPGSQYPLQHWSPLVQLLAPGPASAPSMP